MRRLKIILVLIGVVLLSSCDEDKAPVIELEFTEYTLELGDVFTYPECTVTDDVNLNLVCSKTGTIGNQPGEYIIMYSATDSAGNKSMESVTVTVVDTTAPVLVIEDTIIEYNVGDVYYWSECDGTDNHYISLCVEDVSNLDMNTIGSYIVYVYAVDPSDNESNIVELTVLVTDESRPVISLYSDSVTINYGEEYILPICEVTDEYDIGLICQYNDSHVDVDTIGNYTVIYSATDASGNIADVKSFVVVVEDNTPPTFNLDDSVVYVEHGDTYTIPDCVSIDEYDGEVSCNLSEVNLDLSSVGEYFIKWESSDNSGNEVLYELTVIIEDTTPPVMILDNTSYPIILGDEMAYPNPYVDEINGYAITVNDIDFDTLSMIDTSQLGTYTFTYQVTDIYGNVSESITVTVIVNPVPLFAYYDGFTFDMERNMIIAYDYSQGYDVVIPDSIYDAEVLYISDNAFNSSIYVNSLTIPDTILDFGERGLENFELETFEDLIITGDSSVYDNRWHELFVPYPSYNGFTYDLGTGTIMSYDISYGLDVTVPGMIDGTIITGIGEGVFRSKSFDSITLPSSITHLYEDAFFFTDVDTLTLPSSLEYIGEQALYSYHFNVVVPSSVTTIELDALPSGNTLFLGDETVWYDQWTYIGLEFSDQLLPMSLTDGTWIIEPDGTIVGRTTSDKNVVIPSTVSGIDVLHLGAGLFDYESIESVILPEGLVTIGKDCFKEHDLETVVIPSTVTYIGDNAFKTSNDYSFIINGDSERFINDYDRIGIPIRHTEGIFTIDELGYITYINTVDITDLVIPSTVNSIPVKGIYGDVVRHHVNLESIILPAGFEYIGEEAFRFTSITSIHIPESVRYIGENFVPEEVTVSIDGTPIRFVGQQFYDKYLTTEHNGLLFNEYTNTITGYTDQLGSDVVIPTYINNVRVLHIGKDAFKNASITSVSFSEGLLTIGYNAFGSSSVNTVSFSSTIKSIENSAFYYTNLSGSIALPNDLVYLGPNAFRNTSISSINFNDKLEMIGDSAFYSTNITTLDIPGNVKYIGHGAFYNLDLIEINLNEGTKYIDANAFKGHLDTTLFIPSSIKHISQDSFKLETGLEYETLAFGGDYSLWLTKWNIYGFTDNVKPTD